MLKKYIYRWIILYTLFLPVGLIAYSEQKEKNDINEFSHIDPPICRKDVMRAMVRSWPENSVNHMTGLNNAWNLQVVYSSFRYIDCLSYSRMFWPDIVVLCLELMSYISFTDLEEKYCFHLRMAYHEKAGISTQFPIQRNLESSKIKTVLPTFWSGSGPPREAYRFAIKGEHLKTTENRGFPAPCRGWIGSCGVEGAENDWCQRDGRGGKFLKQISAGKRKKSKRNRISVGSLVKCLAIHLYIHIFIYIYRIWSDYMLFH